MYTFFTTWVLILVVFQNITHHYFDLLYLSFLTLCMGSYISFIDPKKYEFEWFGKKYVLDGYHKTIVDIIHVCLFIFCILHYSPDCHMKLFNSILLILIYFLVMDAEKVYGVSVFKLFIIFVVSNLLYFFI